MRMLAYVLLTLVLVPLYLVGTVCYFAPLLRSRGRISGTAYEPFTGRLLFDLLGTRADPWAMRLAAGLPATNAGFMSCMMRPMAWASRLTGFTPNAYLIPPRKETDLATLLAVRTRFADQALESFVAEGGQVVVLGAGWDTRLYPLQGRGDLRLFEVDAPATQAQKREALASTGIDASGVRFVPCDFLEQSWPELLVAAGLDREQRTFVLWEGVSMYLDEQAVNATLDVFATLPDDSRLVFDVFLRPWLEGTRAGRSAQRAVRISYGETFLWSMPADGDFDAACERFLVARGLTCVRGRSVGAPACPAYGVLEVRRDA